MTNITANNKRVFYFSYQLRIELVPYIHQQTQAFAQHCKNIDSESDEEYVKTVALAKKRRDDLEGFYKRFYMDFRAPLIVETINLMRIILCGLYRGKQPRKRVGKQQVSEIRNQQDSRIEENVNNTSKQSPLKNSSIKQKSKFPYEIPNPKNAVLVKSSSTVLKIINKKSVSTTKSIEIKKGKSETSLSKIGSSKVGLQAMRRGSEEVSAKVLNGLNSSKELIGGEKQKEKKEVKSKQMSKSQYMSYLTNKQKVSK